MAKVESYTLVASWTGRPIRKATQVTLEDGRVVKFMERLPKVQAIAQARAVVARERGGMADAFGREPMADTLDY